MRRRGSRLRELIVIDQDQVLIKPSVNYINTTGISYGYSFRKLTLSSTYSLRQYKNDLSSFQDVGFIDGYIDTDSILSFANGLSTTFELYDQISNVLKYTAYNSNPLPIITSDNGSLIIRNNKLVGRFNSSRLSMKPVDSFPTKTICFHSFMSPESGISRMISSFATIGGSFSWIGVMENGSTSSAGGGFYYKNKTLISPINRGILYNSYLDQSRVVSTIKNLTLNQDGTKHFIKGYNISSSFPYPEFFKEELIYDENALTLTDISNIEDNMINLYN